MSDDASFAFGRLIPGFDFLKQLTAPGSSAGGVGLAHWVAPTVNVEELEQRISDLKTIQFWLEQNLLALKATIQALEVQKMTLATLRGMNLSISEVAKAFSLPAVDGVPSQARATSDSWPFPSPKQAEASKRAPAVPDEAPAEVARSAPPEPPAAEADTDPSQPAEDKGVADAMQWWGALSQQFQEIAMQTMQQATDRALSIADGVAAAAEAGQIPTVSPTRKKSTTAKKTTAKKTAAKKSATRKTTAKKTPAKKTPAKKTAAGKRTVAAKKASARRSRSAD